MKMLGHFDCLVAAGILPNEQCKLEYGFGDLNGPQRIARRINTKLP
jgi:hypothetical protein